MAKKAVSITLIVVSHFFLCGCGDGGRGDEAPQLQTDVLGDGRKISSLTNPMEPRPSTTEIVEVTGARVLFVDNFDETKEGRVGTVYLQDFTESPKPYGGILAFQPSYSPPSFRATIGDVIDASGIYVDFHPAANQDDANWLLPELVGPSIKLRFDAPFVPINPIEINLDDLIDYAKGRQWISMLVTLKNVVVYQELFESNSGRASIIIQGPSETPINKFPRITNELFDLPNSGFSPQKGEIISSVTGIITIFGQFQIAPRSIEDIQYEKP